MITSSNQDPTWLRFNEEKNNNIKALHVMHKVLVDLDMH